MEGREAAPSAAVTEALPTQPHCQGLRSQVAPPYRVLGSQEMQLSCTWLDAFMSSSPEQCFRVFALMGEPPT